MTRLTEAQYRMLKRMEAGGCYLDGLHGRSQHGAATVTWASLWRHKLRDHRGLITEAGLQALRAYERQLDLFANQVVGRVLKSVQGANSGSAPSYSIIRVGTVTGARSMVPVPPRSRRRCSCGCKQRATHMGLGDGVALMRGCELYVRRWVRDGAVIYRRRRIPA